MNIRSDVTQEENVFKLTMSATCEIGVKYFSDTGDSENELQVVNQECVKILKQQILKSFPALKDSFLDEKSIRMNKAFGSGPGGLDTCIEELIQNAIDASAMKCIDQGKKKLNLELKIKMKQQDNEFVLRISDNGSGFNQLKAYSDIKYKKTYEQLFENTTVTKVWSWFFNSSTKKNKPELIGKKGVGLKTVNNICQDFGGNLFFENRKNSNGAKVEMSFIEKYSSRIG